MHQMLDIESLKSATLFGDKTPYNNDGTKKGSVLKFDGGDDYVIVADSASLNFSDEVTISAWMYFDSVAGYLLDKRVSDSPGFLSVYFVDGTAKIYINDENAVTTPIDTFVSDEWVHITITAKNNSTDNHIYKNGVDVSTGAVAKAFATNAGDMIIGARHSLANFFNGSIADVRIYNRALETAEITSLFQSYRSKIKIQ